MSGLLSVDAKTVLKSAAAELWASGTCIALPGDLSTVAGARAITGAVVPLEGGMAL